VNDVSVPGRSSTPWWWLLAFLLGGTALYAPILNTWFVADDWDFLLLADRSDNLLVCFTPLLGRFMRPLEVLTYYANYKAFGLHPFPYHFTVVLLHAANTWLVARFAQRLGASRSTAFAAGLIFLVFAGHSEAVTWLGGAADAWLALFVLGGLLLFARALDAERPAAWMAAATTVFAAGFLAKETFVIAPALAAAFGASRLLAYPRRTTARQIITRTAIVAVVTSLTGAGYMLMRAHIFGSVLGAYDELSTSGPMMAAETRAFILRSFLPAGRVATWLWVYNYDVALLAAAAILLGVMFVRYPKDRPALAFLPAALLVSLAPALPLTIALGNSVSERYVYTPTVFSCILIAWLVGLLRRRLLALTTVVCVVMLHAQALVVANRAWVEAAQVCQQITAQLVDIVRAAPPRTRVIVLNVPDTIRGAYSLRSAFINTFYLMARDIDQPEYRVGLLSSTMDRSPRDLAFIERTGPRAFSIQLKRGLFAQPRLDSTSEYTIGRFNSRSFELTFKDSAGPINVFYTSEGRLYEAGAIDRR